MADLNRLEADLGFVRSSVARTHPGMPPALYFLWATLALCGFTLVDLRPAWVPGFWIVAAPAGAVLSGFVGWRHQRRAGCVDAARGLRYAQHWGTLLAVILLGAFLVRGGRVAGDAFGPIVLLLLAQAYIHAGVHLDRPMRWVGLLMAAGYIVVLTMPPGYAWTLTGIAVACSMLLAGVREARADVVAA